ncbi:hypothetical protein Tco_0567291 [Tanacetum coccineum]
MSMTIQSSVKDKILATSSEMSKYEYEIRYHPGKASVVTDALSWKERVKPRRVRAMAMTIQYGVRGMILAAQSEAFKQENVPLVGSEMDEAHASSLPLHYFRRRRRNTSGQQPLLPQQPPSPPRHTLPPHLLLTTPTPPSSSSPHPCCHHSRTTNITATPSPSPHRAPSLPPPHRPIHAPPSPHHHPQPRLHYQSTNSGCVKFYSSTTRERPKGAFGLAENRKGAFGLTGKRIGECLVMPPDIFPLRHIFGGVTVRAMAMTIQYGVRGMILTAQSEAFKQENVPLIGSEIDEAHASSKEWNSGDDQLRLRWMIYLVVLENAAESVKDTIGFEHCLASSSGWTKKRGKLAPRYVGPFEILERIVPVAYRLRFPEELSGVHDMFHVSNLKKCFADASLHVPLDEIKVDKTLCFVEEPVEIRIGLYGYCLEAACASGGSPAGIHGLFSGRYCGLAGRMVTLRVSTTGAKGVTTRTLCFLHYHSEYRNDKKDVRKSG